MIFLQKIWRNYGGGTGMENRDNVKEKENSATDVLGALVKQLKTMWIAIFVLLAILFVTNGMDLCLSVI